jgi:redox-sensing transcriptional repressor
LITLRTNAKVPAKAVPRLSLYYRSLVQPGVPAWISSQEISRFTGFTAAQVRKDLGYFGQFGWPGKGYSTTELKKSLAKILGLDRRWKIALIGVGNLGMALLGYRGFKDQGFEIIAAFDSDSRKAGRQFQSVTVYPVEQMPRIMREKKIRMAILTVPREAAQEAAEMAVKAGARAILNFAPASVRLPAKVKVRNIDMTIEIERLTFLSLRG